MDHMDNLVLKQTELSWTSVSYPKPIVKHVYVQFL